MENDDENYNDSNYIATVKDNHHQLQQQTTKVRAGTSEEEGGRGGQEEMFELEEAVGCNVAVSSAVWPGRENKESEIEGEVRQAELKEVSDEAEEEQEQEEVVMENNLETIETSWGVDEESHGGSKAKNEGADETLVGSKEEIVLMTSSSSSVLLRDADGLEKETTKLLNSTHANQWIRQNPTLFEKMVHHNQEEAEENLPTITGHQVDLNSPLSHLEVNSTALSYQLNTERAKAFLESQLEEMPGMATALIIIDPSKELVLGRSSTGECTINTDGRNNANIVLINLQLNSQQSTISAPPTASSVDELTVCWKDNEEPSIIHLETTGNKVDFGKNDRQNAVSNWESSTWNVQGNEHGEERGKGRSTRLQGGTVGQKQRKANDEDMSEFEGKVSSLSSSSSKKRKASSRLVEEEPDFKQPTRWPGAAVAADAAAMKTNPNEQPQMSKFIRKMGSEDESQKNATDQGFHSSNTLTGLHGNSFISISSSISSNSTSSNSTVVAPFLRTFTCLKCNKDFASEKYLTMHLSLHNEINAFHTIAGKELIREGISGAAGGLKERGMAAMADLLPIRRTKSTSPAGTTSQWTCKICEKTFAQNSNYKNHIRTHSNERPFVCEICSIGFKERYHLKKHVLFKHTTDLKEECRVCGKKFKDSTAVRAHERTHSDQRPYACTRCDKTFKTSECLWHHENRSKTCGKALGEQQKILQEIGGAQNSGRRRKDGDSREGEGREEGGRRQMQQVGELQSPQTTLAQTAIFSPHHSVIQQHSNICPIPISRQRMAQEPVAVLQISEDHLPPVAMGFHSTQWNHSVLKESEKKETTENALERSAAGSGRVGIAIPAVKVEMEMNICDYDLTGLTSSDSALEEYCEELERDEDDEDDDEDDDDDEVGGKSSATLAAIAETIASETGSTFIQRTIQEHHNYIHKQQEQSTCKTATVILDGLGGPGSVPPAAAAAVGRRQLDCMRCGKQCSTQSAYDKHSIVHSEERPHRCDECDIGFKLKVHLKKHNLYRHSDEYPCECSICGKRFKDSSAVRLHERIHSTERPFKCHCGKGFKTRENLWGHRHRGPCEKPDEFLFLQNLRIFNSDIGPIWGVPVNVANDQDVISVNGNDKSHNIVMENKKTTAIPTTLRCLKNPPFLISSQEAASTMRLSSNNNNNNDNNRSIQTVNEREKGEGRRLPTTPNGGDGEEPGDARKVITQRESFSFSKFPNRTTPIASSVCLSSSSSSSSSVLSSVTFLPTAVVVPIKREVVVDQNPSKSDSAASSEMQQHHQHQHLHQQHRQVPSPFGEKYSLPPFETLVTTHHRPINSWTTTTTSSLGNCCESSANEATDSTTPSSITDKSSSDHKFLTRNEPKGVTPAAAATTTSAAAELGAGGQKVKLPCIQQLFQVHSVSASDSIISLDSIIPSSSSPSSCSSSTFGLMASASRFMTSSKMAKEEELLLKYEDVTSGDQLKSSPSSYLDFSVRPPPPYPGHSSLPSNCFISSPSCSSPGLICLTSAATAAADVIYSVKCPPIRPPELMVIDWAPPSSVGGHQGNPTSSSLSSSSISSSSAQGWHPSSETDSALNGDLSIASNFRHF